MKLCTSTLNKENGLKFYGGNHLKKKANKYYMQSNLVYLNNIEVGQNLEKYRIYKNYIY